LEGERIWEKRGKEKLVLKISFYEGNDRVNFMLDIALHGRSLEHPTPVFGSPLEVMGIALQLLDFSHPLMRIIVPAE